MARRRTRRQVCPSIARRIQRQILRSNQQSGFKCRIGGGCVREKIVVWWSCRVDCMGCRCMLHASAAATAFLNIVKVFIRTKMQLHNLKVRSVCVEEVRRCLQPSHIRDIITPFHGLYNCVTPFLGIGIWLKISSSRGCTGPLAGAVLRRRFGGPKKKIFK